MRIATTGFSHESNTFSTVPATLERWKSDEGILEGDAIRAQYATSKATLAGFFALADEDPDVTIVPLVFARLTPMGAITAEAIEHLMDLVTTALQENGPWDAVLLPQHGAAVSETYLDADGEMIRRVREVIGPDVPIGVTLDMHANLSHQMVQNADIVTVYQTNPHIDAYEQALLCGHLIAQTVRGEIHPRMTLVDPPLVVNILRQGTSDAPMRDLLVLAREQSARPGVLSVSVVEGFPYADVPDMGMAFLAVTDDDTALGTEIANSLADAAWSMRNSLIGDSWKIDEALQHADAAAAGPVVLFDVGDNVGGGSTGDSTHVLHEAQRLGIRGVLQGLSDPDVVRQSQAAGVGGRVDVFVGGKTDGRHGKPLHVQAVVTALSDGRYEDPKPTHGGFRFYDDGPTTALKTDDGLTLVVTSKPAGTSSLEQFRAVGIDPLQAKILVVKGVHSPRAAVEPIASEMLWLATPGAGTADLSTFTYKNRRRPMFPFEADAVRL
jgi:microcystin degradation protein MlrC